MRADPAKLLPAAEALFPDATVEEIDCGGFACTFKVTKESGDAFAVKIIDPDKSTDPVRTEREIIALKNIDHPNVVSYQDAGHISLDGRDVTYLVMDFVEGESLTKRFIRDPEFSHEEIAMLLKGLYAGASAIWAAGLAHRDLNPNNILITEAGEAVIVDLGIARHMDLPTITFGPTPGTPGWMSPEQVSGDFDRGDDRSDQFVLGLVLHRLATGADPYFALSPMEMLLSPAEKELLPARYLRPDLPFSVGDLIRRLTDRDPLQRFPDGVELADAVETAAARLAAGDDEGPTADPILFGPAVGQRKKYLTEDDFLKELDPEIVALDARSVKPHHLADWVTRAHAADAIVALDPQTVYEQAATEFRADTYVEHGYSDATRTIDSAFKDDVARSAFVRPGLKHQFDKGMDVLISPYLHAGDEWAIEESLALGELAKDIAENDPEFARENARLPTWHACCIDLRWVRPPNLPTLIKLISRYRPEVLYVPVVSSQSANVPLNDDEALQGLGELIRAARGNRTKIIFPKRFSSGLLLLALGASGWTTGHEGTVQNAFAPPEANPSGGQSPPWYYAPGLLNSVRLETRNQLLAAHTKLMTPTDPYAIELFKNYGSLSVPERGKLLTRHNIYCLREQARALGALPTNQRLSLMRNWIVRAAANYAQITRELEVGEQGGFLDAWAKAL